MPETYAVGVTGAAGYIGSRVVADLLAAGHDVVATDNFYDAKVETIDGLGIDELDVRERDRLRDAFNDVDAIMHLAAITGVQECEEHPELAFDVNVQGTENVAWLCRESGTPLVFPASMAIIGDPVEFPITSDHPRQPLNEYGLTKAMGEEDIGRLATGAFPATVLMKSNLYGHHDVAESRVGKRTVINLFVERARAGEGLQVHEPGTQSRDFVHINDVGRAYLLALEYLMEADDGARTVPIGSGECLSVLDLAETIQRLAAEELGADIEVELVENPRDVDETVTGDFNVDTEDARAVLGFEASRTLEETVRGMLAEPST